MPDHLHSKFGSLYHIHSLGPAVLATRVWRICKVLPGSNEQLISYLGYMTHTLSHSFRLAPVAACNAAPCDPHNFAVICGVHRSPWMTLQERDKLANDGKRR